ncbi:MAG: hypothetical protein WC780_03045 [Lentimicrobiaceae bacterium]|jgi:hypothetical protein
MKNLILALLAIGISTAMQAQITAADYFKKAPAIPGNDCQVKGDRQDAFVNSVNELISEIKDDVNKRNKEANDYMNAHQDEMKANMVKKSGMSDEDIKKLQSGKDLSEAEKNEMANKMIQQQANMSLDEAKNLKNMSKEGQQAWAQGYAAEQMAMAQANPGQYQAANQANMNQYALLSEQTTLRNKITAQESTLQQHYRDLDTEAEIEKANLAKELKPLYDELNSINDGEGSTQADVDHAEKVIKKINALQDKYCEQFTPRILEFIKQCKTSFEASIPDYDRIEEIQYQITAAQTGTALMTAGKGNYSIQAVNQYLGYLSQAYRYKLYRTE